MNARSIVLGVCLALSGCAPAGSEEDQATDLGVLDGKSDATSLREIDLALEPGATRWFRVRAARFHATLEQRATGAVEAQLSAKHYELEAESEPSVAPTLDAPTDDEVTLHNWTLRVTNLGDTTLEGHLRVVPIHSCSELDPRTEPSEVFVAPDGVEGLLTDFIASATETLDVQMYILSTDSMIEALRQSAAERHVRVRLIVDRNRTDSIAAAEELEAAGVEWRPSPEGFSFYHIKTLVADGRRALVFSGNFNDFAMTRERNYGAILNDADDIADITRVFDHDWTGTSEPVELDCTRMVVSPVNSRDRIESLVGGAIHRLRIQELGFGDDALLALVRERVAAGVEVQVLLADPSWIGSNTEDAAALREAGADVRIYTRHRNHAKLIIADEGAAFIGSENVSATSLDKNREMGVVLTDDASLGTLSATFDDDWAATAP